MTQTDAPTERVRVRRRRPSSTRTTQRRRPAFWIGCGLIAAGLAVLGWVAWQFWGTNWVSHQRQGDVREALADGWGQGSDVVRTDFGNASAIVHIPRFGKDYAVPVLEGDSPEVLAAGIGHVPDTAKAGAEGNYVLAAHRVTHGEPFAKFPELKAGDKVIVETRTATYTYVLDNGGTDLIIPLTQTWVLDSLPTNPRAGGVSAPPTIDGKPNDHVITLFTCSEIFHTDNRSVTFGHLVDVQATGEVRADAR